MSKLLQLPELDQEENLDEENYDYFSEHTVILNHLPEE